ncbi:MAG TPA: AAA family ATPase [Ktedonobacterales bacterium]|jgi:DNA-binding SARP family transcriptional activator
MSRLALFLLGAPRIERDNLPISVDTRKAIALIAYLAVTHERQSRDRLAALLWPDYDQTHARAALRRTLSTLNKALAGEWLNLEREQLNLHPGPDLWLDVEVFSHYLAACRTHGHPSSKVCPACIGPLAEAVSLYRDDFLAGFSLRDSPDFDDWQFFQAESLRRDLAGALERLVYGYSALGQFDAAITTGRRWLALDRLHEPAHRYLMQLYTWAGQRAAALHQYRECVQVLEQELGVAPLEATTQLYQAIKENHAPPPPEQWQTSSAAPEDNAASARNPKPATATGLSVSSPPNNTYSASGYPLVGRAAEWSTLTRSYAASSACGQLIVIEGEAGIGKTRLAEEFLASVQNKGAAVSAARCYEGETHLAYGPIGAGLRAAIVQQGRLQRLEGLSPLWLSEAARLLPELGSLRPDTPPAPPLDSPGAQSRFFEGLKHVIQALCSDAQPGLLFLDDAHWADSASLDLLTYLTRRLYENRFSLIFTWRSELVPPGHRLQHLLSEAQRSGNATILSLARLSQPTVGELVRSATAGDAALVDRLYQETEGLPFFLVEYLAALANGVLTAESENWSLPGGVRDLLRSRLVAVSETGWQLLTAAAAIGRSFDFDTLREASGRSEEETVTALEELLTRRLVREVQGGAGEQALIYDFSHEKLRELVYEETSLARRRLLHRRIAEALVSRTRGVRESSALTGQIARHYRLAGTESAAAEYFRLAGERARNLYANTESLEHFQTALALGYPEPAALHVSIGDLHTLLGEYSAALRSYETAAALAEPGALAGIEHKLGAVYERRGDWELAESHFEAALAALGETGATETRSSVYADWSRTAHHRGETSRALELARQALDLAEVAQERRALAQAHNILGILTSSQGDLIQAQRHLEESLALAEQLNDQSARVAALNNLALVCRTSGAIDRAIELTKTALALCAAQGDRHREAALHNNLADLLHSSGRTEDAMPHLKQAVSLYAEIDLEAGALQPEIWKLTEW